MSAWSATQVQNARSRLKSEQRNDAVNFCRSSRPMPFCKQSLPKSLPELILFVPRFHVGFGILQSGSGKSTLRKRMLETRTAIQLNGQWRHWKQPPVHEKGTKNYGFQTR